VCLSRYSLLCSQTLPHRIFVRRCDFRQGVILNAAVLLSTTRVDFLVLTHAFPSPQSGVLPLILRLDHRDLFRTEEAFFLFFFPIRAILLVFATRPFFSLFLDKKANTFLFPKGNPLPFPWNRIDFDQLPASTLLAVNEVR